MSPEQLARIERSVAQVTAEFARIRGVLERIAEAVEDQADDKVVRLTAEVIERMANPLMVEPSIIDEGTSKADLDRAFLQWQTLRRARTGAPPDPAQPWRPFAEAVRDQMDKDA